VPTCKQAKTSPIGTVNGTITQSGLSKGGRLTKVTLNSVTWTALPVVPLEGRNGLSIQNISAAQIVLDYVTTNAVYEGVIMNTSAERFYSITDAIVIYAKAQAGTPTIMVEELA